MLYTISCPLGIIMLQAADDKVMAESMSGRQESITAPSSRSDLHRLSFTTHSITEVPTIYTQIEARDLKDSFALAPIGLFCTCTC